MKPHKSDDILKYSSTPRSRATVARHYQRWRAEHGLPVRCDVPTCMFHTAPLQWRVAKLPVILDHISGNNLDNSPKNLRYLCPNCDSQLPTRGGANRGRVHEAEEGTFVLMDRDGRRHYHVIPETAHLRITGHAPTILIRPK